jgi:hypothetical protein
MDVPSSIHQQYKKCEKKGVLSFFYWRVTNNIYAIARYCIKRGKIFYSRYLVFLLFRKLLFYYEQ